MELPLTVFHKRHLLGGSDTISWAVALDDLRVKKSPVSGHEAFLIKSQPSLLQERVIQCSSNLPGAPQGPHLSSCHHRGLVGTVGDFQNARLFPGIQDHPAFFHRRMDSGS